MTTTRSAPRFTDPCALAALLMAAAATSALAAPPPAADTLTEGTASSWGASADSATVTLFNDTARVKVGSQSMRLETNAPFDCRWWAPNAKNASWNVGAAGGPSFWIYAENPSPYGFQNLSPWVRLATNASNYYDFKPSYDLLNDARGQWLRIEIPLTGNGTWTRTSVGSPSLSNIAYVEIHADTWDAGFTLWIDDFGFTTPPPPPQGVSATPLNNAVAVNWQTYNDVTGTFTSYKVYRDTVPFTTTVGRTALTTLNNINTVTYTDNTAVNGNTYYYAVSATFTGGVETTQVQSVGPVTPRNETDLQVVCIARTPRYPRYDATYSYYEVTEPGGFGPYAFTSATGLGGGQTGATQRFPNVGATVTYTATIRNRGTTTWNTPIQGRWKVDGVTVSQPVLNVTLAPAATTTTALNQTWDDQHHTIEFSFDNVDGRAGNNYLETGSKSVAFLSYIDQTYYNKFQQETANYPQATTDDFIDWLNLHMRRFNDMFAEASCAKRVHFDVLQILADSASDPASPSTIYFAIFPYRYRATDGSLRFSGYYHPDEDLDYGLLHEMAHQLGLIDIYQLDVPPEANQVSGQGYSAVPCLMHGVSPFLSAHSAGAMTHWLNKAHGYFGQYLYKLPATTRLRLLGSDNQPLVGATVKMYQYCERPGVGKVITNQIKAQGTTDASGYYTLPNVPINTGMVPTTYAGDSLAANPFGYVAVVGTNGVLLFRVEHQGGVDYAWLDITECNVAYWQGQTATATFDRTLALGGPIQTRPPADMAELNANDWSAWAQGSSSAATYVLDDTSRKIVGGGSVKFVTDGGFDTYVGYPRTLNAQWDLSAATKLKVSFYAENPNFSFQGGSPWIRLKDADNNYFEYQYYSGGGAIDLLNQAQNQWRSYEIPLNASSTQNNGWRRTTVGTPSLSNIKFLEIHADTWGGGFTLWVDGVGFDLPGPGDFDNDGDVDTADMQTFAGCRTGPTIGPPAPNCAAADLDEDNDVDQDDFGILQRCYAGSGTPSPAGCAD